MNILGRHNSTKEESYRRSGLKKRGNHELRLPSAAEAEERLEAFGPEAFTRTPDWGKLPEEALVTG